MTFPKFALAITVLAALLAGATPAAAAEPVFTSYFTYSSAPSEVLGKNSVGIRKLTPAEASAVPKSSITAWSAQFVQDPAGARYKIVWESVTPITAEAWTYEGSPTPKQVSRLPKLEFYTYASAPAEVIVRSPLGVFRHAKTGEQIPAEQIVHWGGTSYYRNAGNPQVHKKSWGSDTPISDRQWIGEGSPTPVTVGTYTPPPAPTVSIRVWRESLNAPADVNATVTMSAKTASCDVSVRNTANGGDVTTERKYPWAATWVHTASTAGLGSGSYELRVACEDSAPAVAGFTVTGTLEQQLTAALTPTPVPAGLNMFAPGENSTNPAVHATGCHADPARTTPVLPCHTGAKQSEFVVWLVGDSHAAAWFPALDRIAAGNNIRLITATKSACSPTTTLLEHPVTKAAYTECTAFQKNVLAGMGTIKPDLIITSAATAILSKSMGGFAPMLAEYAKRSPKVVILGDFPTMRSDPAACLAANPADYTPCHAPRAQAQVGSVLREMESIAVSAGAAFIPTMDIFCDDTTCPAVAGTTRMYKDQSHISPAASVLAAADLHTALAPYLSGSPRDLTAETVAAGGANSTKMTWVAPGNTGSAGVYRYEIRWAWASDAGLLWTTWKPVTGRSFTLYGLDPGAVRTVEVRALHSGGFSTAAKVTVTQR